MALQSAVAVYVSANSAQAALATRPPTALVAINSGGSSSPRIIIAPAPEVGSEAMSDPTNGPLRSTTTCCHTIEAVILILSAILYQKHGSASAEIMSRRGVGALHRSSDWRRAKPAVLASGQALIQALRQSDLARGPPRQTRPARSPR